MKRKMIPLFLMLVAGAITSIMTYIKNYELMPMLWTLLGVLVGFYVLGVIIEKVLDLFDAEIEERRKAEGAVIEKDMVVNEETAEEQEAAENEVQADKQDTEDAAEESAE